MPTLDSKLADVSIKFCDSCKKCWEIVGVHKWKKRKRTFLKTFLFLDDFPSWGKKRMDCYKCADMDIHEFAEKNYVRKLGD